MRFALLGDHADGWSAAKAALATGRHEIAVYSGKRRGDDLQELGPNVRRVNDLEEILADPAIDAVIVAGALSDRLNQLRRVLQSERPALVVLPIDRKPDGVYEMSMLQGDVHQALMPIQQDLMTPSFRYPLVLVDLVWPEPSPEEWHLTFWPILRRLGGEITEVSAYAIAEEPIPGEHLFINGRFVKEGIFRAWIHPENRRVVDVRWTKASCSLPWPEHTVDVDLIERFEAEVERQRLKPRVPPSSGAETETAADVWLSAIRCAELDDAVLRSLERRRVYGLDYQEANEEVGFKGTMTLVGCGLLWLIVGLAVLTMLFPVVPWYWISLAALVVFLGLQALRWVIPKTG